jgi:hypothetical protein
MKDGSSKEKRRLTKWDIDLVKSKFAVIEDDDFQNRIAELAKESYRLNHQLRISLSSIEIHKNSVQTKMNEQKPCDVLSSQGVEVKDGNDQSKKNAA